MCLCVFELLVLSEKWSFALLDQGIPPGTYDRSTGKINFAKGTFGYIEFCVVDNMFKL
jgi:hypothetical protein